MEDLKQRIASIRKEKKAYDKVLEKKIEKEILVMVKEELNRWEDWSIKRKTKGAEHGFKHFQPKSFQVSGIDKTKYFMVVLKRTLGSLNVGYIYSPPSKFKGTEMATHTFHLDFDRLSYFNM